MSENLPIEEDEIQEPNPSVENFMDLLPRIDFFEERQLQDLLHSFVDRMLTQERDLEKMELKCKAYEKIIRSQREKLKSLDSNIEHEQSPKEDQVTSESGTTDRRNRKFTLRKHNNDHDNGDKQ